MVYDTSMGKKNVGITLDSSIHKDATRIAKIERRSFSSLVEHCLWMRVQEHHLRDRAKPKASRKA